MPSVIEVVNPATEEVLGDVPDASGADLAEAVEAAEKTRTEWAELSWTQRAALMQELADRVAACGEELARMDVADAGLTIAAARSDVAGAVAEIRYFAGLAGETKGVTLPPASDSFTFTERSEYGLVGRIIPFNHPIKFAAGKIAAPLAAGNCTLLKPSEHTSLSALELARLAEEVLPPGALRVLTGRGSGVGAGIVTHPDIPRIAFTGSVAAGRAVLRAAAEAVKAVTVELGGKNPLIVFPDVDIEQAAQAAVRSMNLARCAGQSCQSTSRVFVHQRIAGPFVDALVAAVARLRVGDPAEETTDVGPVTFAAHYDRVLHYIEVGRAQGARLLCGGGRPPGMDQGYFIAPTVFADVTDDMAIAREEIFGPVLAVLTWADDAELTQRVNDSPFGLTANIWTNDISSALRCARAVDAGAVWVNGTMKRPLGAPFGGWKASGLGKETALDELLSYTREKTITVAVSV